MINLSGNKVWPWQNSTVMLLIHVDPGKLSGVAWAVLKQFHKCSNRMCRSCSWKTTFWRITCTPRCFPQFLEIPYGYPAQLKLWATAEIDIFAENCPMAWFLGSSGSHGILQMWNDDIFRCFWWPMHARIIFTESWSEIPWRGHEIWEKSVIRKRIEEKAIFDKFTFVTFWHLSSLPSKFPKHFKVS